MKKFASALLLSLLLVLSTSVAHAASPSKSAKPAAAPTASWSARSSAEAHVPTEDVLFEETFVVDASTTVVRVGFVTLQFMKDCLPEGMDAIKLTASVYTEKGMAVLEVTPDVEGFQAPVRIVAGAWKGWLFDKETKENVWVSFSPHDEIVTHFSRYCWQ